MVVLNLYLTLLRPRRLWHLRLWLCNEFRTVTDLVHYTVIRLATGTTNGTLNPEMPPFPDQGVFCKEAVLATPLLCPSYGVVFYSIHRNRHEF